MAFKHLFLFLAFTLVSAIGCAQELVLYKEIDSTKLYMEVYTPYGLKSDETAPAMVFFFGGGWKGGTRAHFENHAKHFSKRGMVCFLVDYRTSSQHNTTPFESLKDAKSAIRFVRKNERRFQVDASRIIAAGGSAGGHLAAATALIKDYNEESDDLSISSVPDALVLFNPVIDNGPGGYGYERIGNEYKRFSPLHNIVKDAPPTILFLGTKDALIPVETAEYYKTVMEKVGSRCDLHLYEDKGHGFFNYDKFDMYKSTVTAADEFLVSLGYLQEEPVVIIE